MSKNTRHWSKVGETGTVLGMKSLLLVHQLFGRWAFRIILLPVMGYYYLKNSIARNASKQYLELLKPSISSSSYASLSSFKHFMMFGEMMLDKFLVWSGKITRDDVVFETPDISNQMDSENSGGIIIVSHLGNFEVCNALGQELSDMKLTLLVNTEHAEKFNSLMKKVSSSPRIKILQVNDMSPATAMILSERIDAGEYIVIAGDRTPLNGMGRVSIVNFLGKRAPMPQGAFILASLLKCPVYLMFGIKQQTNKYHIYVELFAKQLVLSRKQRDEAITQVVQSYADRLQSYCIKAPLQWFNFFPFWEEGDDSDEAHLLRGKKSE